MKLDIYNKENKKTSSLELPKQFSEEYRADIITRAVLVIQANKRQSYGAFPEAGKRPSAMVSKRRHNYRGTYGIGQSRTPRKVMSVRGTRFNFQGAFAPQTVGGRRAHPPKASKIWSIKINNKERHKAIRSALAATLDKELVLARGHKVPDHYPFIIESSFEQLNKTKEVITALQTLGLTEELQRAAVTKVRAGKGKMRGRKTKTKKSLLLVTAKTCELTQAAINIPGVDVVAIQDINAELLAPGTQAGRLTLYTEQAIKTLEQEQLFTERSKARGSDDGQGSERSVRKSERSVQGSERGEQKAEQKPVSKTTKKPVPNTKKATVKKEVEA